MSIILVDMDGTLDLGSGRPNEAMIARLRESGETIYILSARNKGRLEETRSWLTKYDVPHQEVYLNEFPAGPSSELRWKRYKAEKLIADGAEIALAVDNNAAVRRIYRSLGIEAISPAAFIGPRSVKDLEGMHGKELMDHLERMADEERA